MKVSRGGNLHDLRREYHEKLFAPVSFMVELSFKYNMLLLFVASPVVCILATLFTPVLYEKQHFRAGVCFECFCSGDWCLFTQTQAQLQADTYTERQRQSCAIIINLFTDMCTVCFNRNPFIRQSFVSYLYHMLVCQT